VAGSSRPLRRTEEMESCPSAIPLCPLLATRRPGRRIAIVCLESHQRRAPFRHPPRFWQAINQWDWDLDEFLSGHCVARHVRLPAPHGAGAPGRAHPEPPPAPRLRACARGCCGSGAPPPPRTRGRDADGGSVGARRRGRRRRRAPRRRWGCRAFLWCKGRGSA